MIINYSITYNFFLTFNVMPPAAADHVEEEITTMDESSKI